MFTKLSLVCYKATFIEQWVKKNFAIKINIYFERRWILLLKFQTKKGPWTPNEKGFATENARTEMLEPPTEIIYKLTK